MRGIYIVLWIRGTDRDGRRGQRPKKELLFVRHHDIAAGNT